MLRGISTRRICSRESIFFVAKHAQFWYYITNMPMSAIRFSEKKSRIKFNFFSIAKSENQSKVLKLYHVMSTNAIFVVAQRDFSAQVEIKIGIRRDEKIRFARTNSSSGNPPLEDS